MKQTLEGRKTLRNFGQETCRKKTTGQTLWRQKYNTEVRFKQVGLEDEKTMNFARKKCMLQFVLER